METIEKTTDLIDRIKEIEVFSDIETSSLVWMLDQCTYHTYQVGERIFYPDMPVEDMQIVMEGQYQVVLERDGSSKIMGTWGAGNITGVLPFSRMKTAGAAAIVIEPTYILAFPKSKFTEMVNVDYKLTQNLVAQMSDRIRNFSHLRYQNEKLMSLGKLSAGLAHELNNPASAMVRSAEELYRSVHKTPERFKAIMTMGITPEQTDEINAILFQRLADHDPERFSLLEREEKVDEIQDWLDDHGIDESEDIADTFTEFNLSEADLDKIFSILKGKNLSSILWWLESTLDLEGLVQEIKSSSERIAELVGSIKSYSHMDRGVDVEKTNIHEGIKNTLVMLKHKFKRKNIQVVKNFDDSLPRIKAFPGQLNQIWTNLLDNAIDAMDDEGTLEIATSRLGGNLIVKIKDNGSGIPAEIQDNIFDPFFTTKEIGKGTGLGLDIVRRIVEHHKGDIKLTSEPGSTEFEICFPIND